MPQNGGIKKAVLLTTWRLAYVNDTCFQVCTELTPVTVLYWPWSDAGPLTGQSVPGVGAVVRREESLLSPLSSDPLPLLCHCPPRPLRFWQVILMSMQVKVGVVVVGPLCNLRRLPRKYPGKNRMTKNETESSQTKMEYISTFPLYIYCTTCHFKHLLLLTPSTLTVQIVGWVPIMKPPCSIFKSF